LNDHHVSDKTERNYNLPLLVRNGKIILRANRHGNAYQPKNSQQQKTPVKVTLQAGRQHFINYLG